MRFLRQEVAMPNVVKCIVLNQELPDDNGCKKIGSKAVHPEPGRSATNIGHCETKEVSRKKTPNIPFQVTSVRVPSTSVVKGKKNYK